ncbi:hypothetical protein SLA2020_148590 [Shorea laevis]
MQQLYQDAMCICQHFGNPDCFLTFTCNSHWNEIKEALKFIPKQKVEDHPDLPVRVFKMKLTALLRFIKQRKHFGKQEAIVYIVEFQKKGLPHVHILLWVDQPNKPSTSEDVDK